MPTHSEFLDRCSFIGTRGPCGRKCFRGVCGNHRGKTPMVLCKNCGKRGTSAPHGYCQALETGCRWKSQYGSRNLKEKRDDVDDYIDEILSWDWESYTHPPPVRQAREKSVKPLASTLGRLLQRDFSTAIQRALSEAIQAPLAEEYLEG